MLILMLNVTFCRVVKLKASQPGRSIEIRVLGGCDKSVGGVVMPLARKVVRGEHEKIVPGQGPPVGRECLHTRLGV